MLAGVGKSMLSAHGKEGLKLSATTMGTLRTIWRCRDVIHGEKRMKPQ
jgi:hypothetical protein